MFASVPSAPTADDRPCVLIVVGAPGTPEYAAEFRQSADHWQAAADEGRRRIDRDRLERPGRRAPIASGCSAVLAETGERRRASRSGSC